MDKVPAVLMAASCPFGGGVADTGQELCGVLAGATMLIGALYGRDRQGDDGICYRLTRRFYEQFLADNGGQTRCAPVRARLEPRPKRCLAVIEQGVARLIEIIESEQTSDPLAACCGEPTCPT